jgi:hypothetical protein
VRRVEVEAVAGGEGGGPIGSECGRIVAVQEAFGYLDYKGKEISIAGVCRKERRLPVDMNVAKAPVDREQGWRVTRMI